jgi:hypothetical protein
MKIHNVFYLIFFLIIYSCKNYSKDLHVVENKFQLKHINKSITFNSLIKFDSINYPYQYPKDAIQLYSKTDSIALDIVVRRGEYLDRNINSQVLVQNLFQENIKTEYKNRDSIFHENIVGVFNLKCGNIVYQQRALKGNISQSDINYYKLIPNHVVFYSDFLLDTFRVDLEMKVNKNFNKIDKTKFLSSIIESLKIQ